MKNAKLTLLASAMSAGKFIRFKRPFEDTFIRGYVLDIGPKFFLLAVVSDRIWFDGFECLRVADIRDLSFDPYTGFVEAALLKRRETMPRKPKISIVSIEEILLSTSRQFPILTIQQEKIDPEVCWVGKVLEIEKGQVLLLGISPAAAWDDIPDYFRLSAITRVVFGGDYEQALHLVGGKPKKKKLTKRCT